MRFRFSVADNRRAEFEQRGRQLINDKGYRISGFLPYDHVADTGNNRFVGTENRQRTEMNSALFSRYSFTWLHRDW